MDQRLSEHQIGINKSCYTYNKRPVQLVFSELFQDNLYCIEWEKKIKRWTRRKKEALIEGNYNDLHEFSTCKNQTHFRNKIK
jgi:putative endonuclease